MMNDDRLDDLGDGLMTQEDDIDDAGDDPLQDMDEMEFGDESRQLPQKKLEDIDLDRDSGEDIDEDLFNNINQENIVAPKRH